MDKFNGYKDAPTALQRTRIDPQSNATNIAYPDPASSQTFMHDNVWSILSDAIVKLPTQFVMSFVASRPDFECVLAKPSIEHTRCLLRPYHQIEMNTLLSAFTTSGDTANIFVTHFLCCTTAALVHLKVPKSQASYHREVLWVNVDSFSSFMKNMYSKFIECYVPIRSAQVFAQQIRHVNSVIQPGLQDFLLRLQGYMNVRMVPSLPENRAETAACSSAAHDALQSINTKNWTQQTRSQEKPNAQNQMLNLTQTVYRS